MSAGPIHILRVTSATEDALHLIHEYYEAVGVLIRDTPESIAEICRDPASGIWLAYQDNEAVGCVLLRPLPSVPHAAECKRLYVRPAARGLGVAASLMDALEAFAANAKLRWIYLDSKDDLEAAINLYRKRGYTDCPRYNDNPQATLFLRKPITAAQ